MPKVPFWVFILIALLYFSAIRIDTMDIDASQYAEISREMMKSDNYLQLYDRGADYLDKPPFLFWISAASMKVFGVNNFGFKFPSILFALLAIYATYRLARLLYNDTTARMAALILATCQGMFLMTNDIRCDTILMSCVITAIWLIKEWLTGGKMKYLLWGFAFVGLGMMTKGPIALMVPVFSFASDWILKREWQNFFRPAYLLGLLVIVVLLLPMSIGLYQQFDMHPEKVVNGVKGVSGLRFFYWTQSFGRITGESPWKNGAYFTFLLENMLWSFLPWMLVFLPALFINIINLIRSKFRLTPNKEWLTTGGFIITYCSLAVSGYQLPHYIFVVFPLAAIITAKLLYDLIEEQRYPYLLRFIKPVQIFIGFLLLAAILFLITYVFPANIFFIVLGVACFIGWLFFAIRNKTAGKFFWLSASAIVIANIFVSNHLYPTLLKYQSGSQVGKYIHEHHINPREVGVYKMDDVINSLHFYARGVIGAADSTTGFSGKKYILTMDKGLNEIRQRGYKFSIEKQGQLFKVSELTVQFINPKTRNAQLRQYYLLKIEQPAGGDNTRL